MTDTFTLETRIAALEESIEENAGVERRIAYAETATTALTQAFDALKAALLQLHDRVCDLEDQVAKLADVVEIVQRQQMRISDQLGLSYPNPPQSVN